VVVMFCFLAGGIGAGYISGMRSGTIGKSFITGIGGVAPGIILVLMAASIKHILSSAEVMDTILYWSASRISRAGPYSAALIIYGLVLMLNFFISSGSAKAFLIIPIIAPLADIVGLSRQSAVLAYILATGSQISSIQPMHFCLSVSQFPESVTAAGLSGYGKSKRLYLY